MYENLVVDKDHPLAVEFRCNNGHVMYLLVHFRAWPFPISCNKCSRTSFPLGNHKLSEEHKLKILHDWNVAAEGV